MRKITHFYGEKDTQDIGMLLAYVLGFYERGTWQMRQEGAYSIVCSPFGALFTCPATSYTSKLTRASSAAA